MQRRRIYAILLSGAQTYNRMDMAERTSPKQKKSLRTKSFFHLFGSFQRRESCVIASLGHLVAITC